MLRFSVVIPSYRRRAQLQKLLAGLATMEFPRDQFEVLIVDDGSPAPPTDIANEFQTLLDVRLLAQPHAGPATARNTGAQQARAPYLCFIDDDCRPARDWLSRLAAHFDANPDRGIGGLVINELGSDPYSQASQDLVEYLYEHYNVPEGESRFFTTNNIALPRDFFLAMGGFDTSFPLAAAEDRDLCDRWREEGHTLSYEPDVLVYHAHAMNLRGFLRQHFTYGRGAVYLHSARERRGADLPRLESLGFYWRLLTFPLRRHRWPKAGPMLILAALTQVAYATGFFVEKSRVGGRAAARPGRKVPAAPVAAPKAKHSNRRRGGGTGASV